MVSSVRYEGIYDSAFSKKGRLCETSNASISMSAGFPVRDHSLRNQSAPTSPNPQADSQDLDLSTFESSNFDVAELLNGLTDRALVQSQEHGGGEACSSRLQPKS